jgi:hypothetical protein
MKLTNSDIKLLKSSRAELLNKGIPAGVVRQEVQTQSGKKLFVDSSGDIVDVQGQVIASLDDIKEKGWLTRMVFGEGFEQSLSETFSSASPEDELTFEKLLPLIDLAKNQGTLKEVEADRIIEDFLEGENSHKILGRVRSHLAF